MPVYYTIFTQQLTSVLKNTNLNKMFITNRILINAGNLNVLLGFQVLDVLVWDRKFLLKEYVGLENLGDHNCR